MGEPIILPLTLLATIACMILAMWSDMRIGRARLSVARGRAEASRLLEARRSAAATFRSNALFFLLLLTLLELAHADAVILVATAIVFVVARGVLIIDSDKERGVVRAVAVTGTLAAQLVLAVNGVAALATGG